MGCWGITALESDSGLDTLNFIRGILPADGKLKLENVIEALKKDSWNRPPDVWEANPHGSPVALAEIVVKAMDGKLCSLDHGRKGKKFGGITSFKASVQSIHWLHDYLADTLKYAREMAETDNPLCGWFREEDWRAWQEYVEGLAGRLETIAVSSGGCVELVLQGEGPALEMA